MHLVNSAVRVCQWYTRYVGMQAVEAIFVIKILLVSQFYSRHCNHVGCHESAMDLDWIGKLSSERRLSSLAV